MKKIIKHLKLKLLVYLLRDFNKNNTNSNYKLALSREQQESHKEKKKDIKDTEFAKQIQKELTINSKPLPQRLQSHLDPDVDQIGGYFTYTGNQDHEYEKCVQCNTQFTEGDKVYLTTKINDLDVITPFPYCTNCRKKHATAEKL